MKINNYSLQHADYIAPACEIVRIEDIQSVIAASAKISDWEEDTDVIDL